MEGSVREHKARPKKNLYLLSKEDMPEAEGEISNHQVEICSSRRNSSFGEWTLWHHTPTVTLSHLCLLQAVSSNIQAFPKLESATFGEGCEDTCPWRKGERRIKQLTWYPY